MLAAFGVTASADAAVRVAASIKPVHSLVAAVMEGVDGPELIIQGTTSPHSFSLRPSDARNIQQAELIFMVEDALETSLAGGIDSLGRDARVVKLFHAEGLLRLPRRVSATFEGRDHEGQRGNDAHGDEAMDMHIWLDPINAQTMVRAIAETLSAADAENSATYTANAKAVIDRLDGLIASIDAEVAGVRDRNFIVLHDAYQYFENRFGLLASGAAWISPERSPGARRILELRELVGRAEVVCVLTDLQYDSQIAEVIIEGQQVRTGAADPLGADLDVGPELYFMLLRGMAATFTECLADP